MPLLATLFSSLSFVISIINDLLLNFRQLINQQRRQDQQLLVLDLRGVVDLIVEPL